MYFACVMCLFVLHATADICAWTLATWALRNHYTYPTYYLLEFFALGT